VTDFETDLGDWIDCDADDLNWTRYSEPTPSHNLANTGPTSAHGGEYYLYVEATNNNPSKMAILNGPAFDLTGLTWPVLRFWYHMLGSNMGSLHVDLSNDDGANWTEIWRLDEQRDDQWHEAVVSLAEYFQSPILLRFKGITGSTYRSDIAIDDVYLGESSEIAQLGNNEPQTLEEVPQWFSFNVNNRWACVGIYSRDDHDLKVYSSPEELFLISASANPSDFVMINGHVINKYVLPPMETEPYLAQVYYGSPSTYKIESQFIPGTLTVGSATSDSIISRDEVHELYEVRLFSGRQYTVELTITSGNGYLLLYVMDPAMRSGTPFHCFEYDYAGNDKVARKLLTIKTSGYYGILVVNFSGEEFRYRLNVMEQ
jgi:hypothetical protein